MLILSLFHLIYVLSITAIRWYFCCPFFHCLKPCKLIFSAEVNFESTYWGRQIKKAISQIILCSFYLKVKAAIYNLAAPGQPPIRKPGIIIPSKKNSFASRPLKFSTGLKYSLAGFWPSRNFVLASAGLDGPGQAAPGPPPAHGPGGGWRWSPARP